MQLKKTYKHVTKIVSQNKTLRNCLRLFFVFMSIAILSPFLATDKPLFCKYKGQWLFPAFSTKNVYPISVSETINYNMGNDWKRLNTEFCVFAPCSYNPASIDALNAPFRSPFDTQLFLTNDGQTISIPIKFRHWLGTTQNGNDVLAGIIHGAKISIGVGIISMLIASVIGVSLGAFAGYFENNSLKMGYLQTLAILAGVFMTCFYCFVVRGDKLTESINNGGIWLLLRVLFLFYVCFKTIGGFGWIGNFIDKKIGTNAKINFPADSIVLRTIEILNSLPTLLLIIAISAIAKPSYSLLILIIGFLSWPNIARITRAEFLKTKQLDYITAAKAMGISNYKIIRKHILPNTLPIIIVPIIFGMSGAVLIEAALSFIGIGIPANTVSWGTLLNEAQNNFSTWWLVIFPGICIFALIFTYNKIATELSKKNN